MCLCLCLVNDEQPVKVRLTDVNDELPVFRNLPRPFLTTVSTTVPPGTSVYQLLAQDDDEDSVVRYTLESGTLCHRLVSDFKVGLRGRGPGPQAFHQTVSMSLHVDDCLSIKI